MCACMSEGECKRESEKEEQPQSKNSRTPYSHFNIKNHDDDHCDLSWWQSSVTCTVSEFAYDWTSWITTVSMLMLVLIWWQWRPSWRVTLKRGSCLLSGQASPQHQHTRGKTSTYPASDSRRLTQVFRSQNLRLVGALAPTEQPLPWNPKVCVLFLSLSRLWCMLSTTLSNRLWRCARLICVCFGAEAWWPWLEADCLCVCVHVCTYICKYTHTYTYTQLSV